MRVPNLILTRAVGEAIVLDGDIRVEVVSIDRGRVKLSIQAPLSVPIMREELIQQETRDDIEDRHDRREGGHDRC